MTEMKRADWIGVSRVEGLMMIVVVMIEGNSRYHEMIMWRPVIRGRCWAAEL